MSEGSLSYNLRLSWSRNVNDPEMRPFPQQVPSVQGMTDQRYALPSSTDPRGTFSTISVNAAPQPIQWPWLSVPCQWGVVSPESLGATVDACGRPWNDGEKIIATGWHRNLLPDPSSFSPRDDALVYEYPRRQIVRLYFAARDNFGDLEDWLAYGSPDSDTDGFMAQPALILGERQGWRSVVATRTFMIVDQSSEMSGYSPMPADNSAGDYACRVSVSLALTFPFDRPRYYSMSDDDANEVRHIPSTMSEHLMWPAWSRTHRKAAADEELAYLPGFNRISGNESTTASPGYDQCRVVVLKTLDEGDPQVWYYDEFEEEPFLQEAGWSADGGVPDDTLLAQWRNEDDTDPFNEDWQTFHTWTINLVSQGTVVGFVARFVFGIDAVGEPPQTKFLALYPRTMDPLQSIEDLREQVLQDLVDNVDCCFPDGGIVEIYKMRHMATEPVSVPNPAPPDLRQYRVDSPYSSNEHIDVWSARRDMPPMRTIAQGDDDAIPGGVPSP